MTSLSQDSSITSSEESIKKITGSEYNGRAPETCCLSGPVASPSQDSGSLVQTFPWIPHFSQLCAQEIPNTTISGLEKLITYYIRAVSGSVTECYSRPNRAAKLKRSMSDTLILFHMMYTEIKKPLEHSSILAKISHLIAMYLDMEIKASRRATESLPKIASKLTSALHLYLDQSQDHILDAILRAKNITKNFWELSDLIFRRVLRDSPGSRLYELSYIRYILAFKTWKSVMKGAEERRRITQLAVLKVTPPAGFRERLASGGWLSEVLPRVPKTRTDITLFLMQAKFSVRDKTKVFLKGLSEGSRQGYLGMDRQLFFSEEPPPPSNSQLQEDSGEGSSLINDIWSSICVDSDMDESIRFSAIVGKKSVAKEKKKSRVALELQKGKKKLKLLKELKSLKEADSKKVMRHSAEEVAVVGSSEEAVVGSSEEVVVVTPKDGCRVNGERVAQSRKEQVSKSRIEQLDERRIEQLNRSRIEQVNESRVELVNQSRIEQMDERGMEQLNRSRIEQVNESRIEQMDERRIEQLNRSRIEQVNESRVELVNQSRIEQMDKSRIEHMNESRLEKMPERRDDEQVVAGGTSVFLLLPEAVKVKTGSTQFEEPLEMDTDPPPEETEPGNQVVKSLLEQSKGVALRSEDQIVKSLEQTERVALRSEDRTVKFLELSKEMALRSNDQIFKSLEQSKGVALRNEDLTVNSLEQSERVTIRNEDLMVKSLEQANRVTLRNEDLMVKSLEQANRVTLRNEDLMVKSLEQSEGVALRSEEQIFRSLEQSKGVTFRKEDMIFKSFEHSKEVAVRNEDLFNPLEQSKGVTLRKKDLVKSLEQSNGGVLRSEDLNVKSLEQSYGVALRNEDLIVKSLEQCKGVAHRKEDLIVKSLEQSEGVAPRNEGLVVESLQQSSEVALRNDPQIVKSLDKSKGIALRNEDLIVKSLDQSKGVAVRNEDLIVKSLEQSKGVALRNEDLILQSEDTNTKSLEPPKGGVFRSGDLIVKSLEQLRLEKGGEGSSQDQPADRGPRLDPQDKARLHIDTLKRDHRTFINQQRFSSIYFGPKLPLEAYLQSQHDTSQHRCPCDQCSSNNISLMANHRIILDRYFVNLKGSTGGTVSLDANPSDACTTGRERGKIGELKKTDDCQPGQEVVLSEAGRQLLMSEHSREENKRSTEKMLLSKHFETKSKQVLSVVSKNTGDVERLLRKSRTGEAARRADRRYRSSVEKEGANINQRHKDHLRSSSERLGPCDQVQPHDKSTDSYSKQTEELVASSCESIKRKDLYKAEHVKRSKNIKDEVVGFGDGEEGKQYKLSEDEEESDWEPTERKPDQYRKSPEDGHIKMEEAGQYQRRVKEEPDQYGTSPVEVFSKRDEAGQCQKNTVEEEPDVERTSPMDSCTNTKELGQYNEPDQYGTSLVDRNTKTEEAEQYQRDMKEEPDHHRTSPVDRYTNMEEAGQYMEAEWLRASKGERYTSYKRGSPDDEELLKTISEHSSLPLKKRRAFSASHHRDEELAFPSIHTQPMLSIAQLEEERNRLKGVPGGLPPQGTSLCLPPHLYYPAIYQPLYPPVSPLSAVPPQASGAPPQNLVPGAFTTTFLPSSLECSGRLRFKTPAQLKGFEDLSAAESLISFSNQQPAAFDPPSPPPTSSPPHRVTRRQTRRRTSTRKRKQT